MIKTKTLIKQLNESSKNLSATNKEIFDRIVVYVRTSNIKTKDAEEFLQQILDSILNAEAQGLTVEEMLGTSDIKNYCEEIIQTYKSSYNLLSLSSEYIMYTGIVLFVLSLITFTFDNISSVITYGIDNISFNLTIDLELLIETLLFIPLVILLLSYFRKTCFNKPTQQYKIKEFFIFWLLSSMSILLMVGIFLVVKNMFLFNINIIIALFIGATLYFLGNYLSEQ